MFKKKLLEITSLPLHLRARQLSAFSRLGALGNLDFNLGGGRQVLRSHSKPTRGHLLDGAGRAVPVFQAPCNRIEKRSEVK